MPREFQTLADAIYRDRVLRARLTPPGERLREGPRLFDLAAHFTLKGIRDQFPNWDEGQVQREFRRRLHLQRRLALPGS